MEDIFISKVGYANKEKGSLRLTIPKDITEKLKIKKGDKVIWKLKEDTEDNITITVSKI